MTYKAYAITDDLTVFHSVTRNITTRAYLIAGENDEIRALSPVCTHLGCMVRWDKIKQEFHCPCHGGKYNMFGQVIAGPPPAPLTSLPVRRSDLEGARAGRPVVSRRATHRRAGREGRRAARRNPDGRARADQPVDARPAGHRPVCDPTT